MSFIEVFKHAWNKAQQKQFCHKKLIKLVENAFDKSKLGELLEIFTEALYGCYNNNCADKNPFCARGLEFLAQIAMKITLECVQPIGITNTHGTTSQVYDITLDPFFTNVIKSSLKFCDVDKTEVRFNTCYFVMSLLQNIGNNVEMDYSICNIILDSLVPLLHDPKSNVRIQAIKALVRLQEPSNADCIVLKSFLILSTDPNSEVRKAIINHIAPHPQSYIKVRLRTTDTDLSVRQAAYLKFADVNPKLCLKIIDRNIILNNGLNDQNKKIKHIMSETLLPKWLNSFEGDYLLFFRALRLDADENDINNFDKLCTEILVIFLRKNTITDLVKYLPVNKEDKLIPIPQLRLESVFYWSNLINYLRNVEDGEEYLVNILPELTAFSNYIERIIKEKCSITMDEWENLEYQTILFQLFKIASGFDMSDEVGRKTLYALILQMLTTNKYHQKVIDKVLQVAAQLNSDVGSLTIDLCQIISEIREPLINEVPSGDKLRKQNFEVTQLKVKIHQLEMDEEEALKIKDFQLAHMVQNEMKECQRKLENLKNMFTVSEKVRVSKDDPETLCRCLDILIGILKIPNITVMCSALRSCRDEFLMPLLSNNSSEILWRFILCLGLFSLMDKDLAFKHINFLCLPIATYRVVPNCDKLALKTSIACVTDVIRVFGVKVIGMEEHSQSELNQEGNPTTSRRKLYSEDLSQPEVLNKDDITIEFIIDIIVDMLDDEDEGVRQTASTSIQRLIIHNFPVSPELICRLILKWYSPETEKKDIKLNIQLGTIIECFATKTKGARRVVQKAILPIISSIVNASGTSPLLEIDIENVLRFLAALTNDETETIHDEIALNLIERMLNKPNDACTLYLIKLLTYLELSFKELELCKTIIDSTETLLSDIVDKIPKKYLLKFHEKLTSGFRNASVVMQGDQSEILVTNGTEGNIEDQSSVVRNGELTNENHEHLEDIDASEKYSEDNQKGNSSSSESDSEEDSIGTHSNSTTKGPVLAKGSGKRLLVSSNEDVFEGKTKLRKITEESEHLNESLKPKDCGETTEDSESEIEDPSNKKSVPVFLKYDYTPEKNAERLKNLKKTSNNSENDNTRTVPPQVLQETTVIHLGACELSERAPRSTKLNSNSKNEKIQIKSQVVFQKASENNLEKGKKTSSRSTRSNQNSNIENVQIISQNVLRKTSRKTSEEDTILPVPSPQPTRSQQNLNNKNIQKTPKKNSEKDNLTEGSPRSTRSKQKSNNKKIKVISQMILTKTPKKSLEKDKTSEPALRSTRSKPKSNNEKINVISQMLPPKTPKKSLEKVKPSETAPLSTRSNPKLKTDNIKSNSKVASQRTPDKNLHSNQEELSGSRTPTSVESDNERKHSARRKSIPSKFKDYVSCSKHLSPSETSPKQKQVEKRTAKTPLSTIVNRKSKRVSKRSATEEPASTPGRTKSDLVRTPSRKSDSHLQLSIVGQRVSRRLSKSVTTLSNKKQTKKTRKSLIVVLKRTLRNTPIRRRVHSERQIRTPNSSLKNKSSEVSQESKSGQMKEKSESEKENDTKKSVGSLKGNKPISTKKDIPSTTKGSSNSRKKKVEESHVNDESSSTDEESSKKMEKKVTRSSSSQRNNKEKIEDKKNVKKNNSKKTVDDDNNSTDNSNTVFKKPKRKNSKDKPKDKTNNDKNAHKKTDGILQNLNSVMNEINNTSVSRKSSRIADKSLNESSSTGEQSSKTKTKKHTQQESTSTLTRSRMSDRLNISDSSSRKKLDFSSFSDETLLKTFLQGDEEFQVLENMSIEDVNSSRNTSHDSKKENVSINVSSSSSSSRRSTRRKRNNSGSPEAAPKKKMMKTKYKRNLQRVSK